MFENLRRGRQARNFKTNVPKILELKSSSEQIFSENWRWVPLINRVPGHGQGIPLRNRRVREGPLENLWGGGVAGEVQKKYSRKGKLNEKNSCTPINPKKYSCYGLKKIHTRNLITKKNSCSSKIPLPPHNFSNNPSLIKDNPSVQSTVKVLLNKN